MGVAMLCRVAGIDNSTMENSASYIGSMAKSVKKRKPFRVASSSPGTESSGLYFRRNKD